MPQLVVNLDCVKDCRDALRLLRRRIDVADGVGGEGGKDKQGPKKGPGKEAELPWKQRLRIVSQRGVWKHLVNIAKSDDTPRSLPEWDQHLGLPSNKLRSLKGNFAKLENRFNLCFMRVADQAVPDDNNNPRYIMPPRMRNHILGVVEENQTCES